MKTNEEKAREIVQLALEAGGVGEVRKLAETGWPEGASFYEDCEELRTAIREEAQYELLSEEEKIAWARRNMNV